jgi:hypothetical protein
MVTVIDEFLLQRSAQSKRSPANCQPVPPTYAAWPVFCGLVVKPTVGT